MCTQTCGLTHFYTYKVSLCGNSTRTDGWRGWGPATAISAVPEVVSGVLAHRLTNVSRWADEKNAPGQHRPGTNTDFSSISSHAGGWLLGCAIRTYFPSIYFPYPPEIPHQPSRHLFAPPSCRKCPQEHRSSPRPLP
jgi:hypothetical protein